MRSRLLKLLFAFAMLLGFAVPAAQAKLGVSVSPSRFRLSQPPGETASGEVTVRNEGTYPMRITTEVTDMVTRKNDQGLWIRMEAPAGTTRHSCAGWIELFEGEEAVVPPGASRTVKFVVSPPPTVDSGGYGAYLFILTGPDNLPAQDPNQKPQVQFVTVPRFGISVIYEVQGTLRRSGELLDLSIQPPTSTDPLKIRYGFRNSGNAEVVLTGNFHILNEENTLLGKGGVGTLKTFPSEMGYTETVWDQSRLPPGRYTLLLTLELGPDAQEAIVRELAFSVPETSQPEKRPPR